MDFCIYCHGNTILLSGDCYCANELVGQALFAFQRACADCLMVKVTVDKIGARAVT